MLGLCLVQGPSVLGFTVCIGFYLVQGPSVLGFTVCIGFCLIQGPSVRRDHQLSRGPSETGAAGPGLPLPRIRLRHLGHVCLQVQVSLVAIGAAMEVNGRGEKNSRTVE